MSIESYRIDPNNPMTLVDLFRSHPERAIANIAKLSDSRLHDLAEQLEDQANGAEEDASTFEKDIDEDDDDDNDAKLDDAFYYEVAAGHRQNAVVCRRAAKRLRKRGFDKLTLAEIEEIGCTDITAEEIGINRRKLRSKTVRPRITDADRIRLRGLGVLWDNEVVEFHIPPAETTTTVKTRRSIEHKLFGKEA